MKPSIKFPAAVFAVLFGLIVVLNCHARADLGDTYAIACSRMGSKGTAQKSTNGKGGYILWLSSRSDRADTSMSFHKNQCVAILYVFTNGYSISESEIWRMMIKNSLPSQTWREYYRESNGDRNYVTNDGKILAHLAYNGAWLRISYRSFIDNHGLWNKNDNANVDGAELPPVQDDI